MNSNADNYSGKMVYVISVAFRKTFENIYIVSRSFHDVRSNQISSNIFFKYKHLYHEQNNNSNIIYFENALHFFRKIAIHANIFLYKYIFMSNKTIETQIAKIKFYF